MSNLQYEIKMKENTYLCLKKWYKDAESHMRDIMVKIRLFDSELFVIIMDNIRNIIDNVGSGNPHPNVPHVHYAKDDFKHCISVLDGLLADALNVYIMANDTHGIDGVKMLQYWAHVLRSYVIYTQELY